MAKTSTFFCSGISTADILAKIRRYIAVRTVWTTNHTEEMLHVSCNHDTEANHRSECVSNYTLHLKRSIIWICIQIRRMPIHNGNAKAQQCGFAIRDNFAACLISEALANYDVRWARQNDKHSQNQQTDATTNNLWPKLQHKCVCLCVSVNNDTIYVWP